MHAVPIINYRLSLKLVYFYLCTCNVLLLVDVQVNFGSRIYIPPLKVKVLASIDN